MAITARNPNPSFVIFDFETTGMKSVARGGKDVVVEIAAVRINSSDDIETAIADKSRWFTVRVSPEGQPIHPGAQAVHGISQESLDRDSNTLSQKEAFARLHAFARGANYIVGHNSTGFDINFLPESSPLRRMEQVDTLQMSRALSIPSESKKLGELARHFELPAFEAHVGAEDVKTTLRLLGKLGTVASEQGKSLMDFVQEPVRSGRAGSPVESLPQPRQEMSGWDWITRDLHPDAVMYLKRHADLTFKQGLSKVSPAPPSAKKLEEWRGAAMDTRAPTQYTGPWYPGDPASGTPDISESALVQALSLGIASEESLPILMRGIEADPTLKGNTNRQFNYIRRQVMGPIGAPPTYTDEQARMSDLRWRQMSPSGRAWARTARPRPGEFAQTQPRKTLPAGQVVLPTGKTTRSLEAFAGSVWPVAGRAIQTGLEEESKFTKRHKQMTGDYEQMFFTGIPVREEPWRTGPSTLTKGRSQALRTAVVFGGALPEGMALLDRELGDLQNRRYIKESVPTGFIPKLVSEGTEYGYKQKVKLFAGHTGRSPGDYESHRLLEVGFIPGEGTAEGEIHALLERRRPVSGGVGISTHAFKHLGVGADIEAFLGEPGFQMVTSGGVRDAFGLAYMAWTAMSDQQYENLTGEKRPETWAEGASSLTDRFARILSGEETPAGNVGFKLRDFVFPRVLSERNLRDFKKANRVISERPYTKDVMDPVSGETRQEIVPGLFEATVRFPGLDVGLAANFTAAGTWEHQAPFIPESTLGHMRRYSPESYAQFVDEAERTSRIYRDMFGAYGATRGWGEYSDLKKRASNIMDLPLAQIMTNATLATMEATGKEASDIPQESFLRMINKAVPRKFGPLVFKSRGEEYYFPNPQDVLTQGATGALGHQERSGYSWHLGNLIQAASQYQSGGEAAEGAYRSALAKAVLAQHRYLNPVRGEEPGQPEVWRKARGAFPRSLHGGVAGASFANLPEEAYLPARIAARAAGIAPDETSTKYHEFAAAWEAGEIDLPIHVWREPTVLGETAAALIYKALPIGTHPEEALRGAGVPILSVEAGQAALGDFDKDDYYIAIAAGVSLDTAKAINDARKRIVAAVEGPGEVAGEARKQRGAIAKFRDTESVIDWLMGSRATISFERAQELFDADVQVNIEKGIGFNMQQELIASATTPEARAAGEKLGAMLFQKGLDFERWEGALQRFSMLRSANLRTSGMKDPIEGFFGRIWGRGLSGLASEVVIQTSRLPLSIEEQAALLSTPETLEEITGLLQEGDTGGISALLFPGEEGVEAIHRWGETSTLGRWLVGRASELTERKGGLGVTGKLSAIGESLRAVSGLKWAPNLKKSLDLASTKAKLFGESPMDFLRGFGEPSFADISALPTAEIGSALEEMSETRENSALPQKADQLRFIQRTEDQLLVEMENRNISPQDVLSAIRSAPGRQNLAAFAGGQPETPAEKEELRMLSVRASLVGSEERRRFLAEAYREKGHVAPTSEAAAIGTAIHEQIQKQVVPLGEFREEAELTGVVGRTRITGHADLFNEMGKLIVDIKTGAREPNPTQLHLYAELAEQMGLGKMSLEFWRLADTERDVRTTQAEEVRRTFREEGVGAATKLFAGEGEPGTGGLMQRVPIEYGPREREQLLVSAERSGVLMEEARDIFTALEARGEIGEIPEGWEAQEAFFGGKHHAVTGRLLSGRSAEGGGGRKPPSRVQLPPSGSGDNDDPLAHIEARLDALGKGIAQAGAARATFKFPGIFPGEAKDILRTLEEQLEPWATEVGEALGKGQPLTKGQTDILKRFGSMRKKLLKAPEGDFHLDLMTRVREMVGSEEFGMISRAGQPAERQWFAERIGVGPDQFGQMAQRRGVPGRQAIMEALAAGEITRPEATSLFLKATGGPLPTELRGAIGYVGGAAPAFTSRGGRAALAQRGLAMGFPAAEEARDLADRFSDLVGETDPLIGQMREMRETYQDLGEAAKTATRGQREQITRQQETIEGFFRGATTLAGRAEGGEDELLRGPEAVRGRLNRLMTEAIPDEPGPDVTRRIEQFVGKITSGFGLFYAQRMMRLSTGLMQTGMAAYGQQAGAARAALWQAGVEQPLMPQMEPWTRGGIQMQGAMAGIGRRTMATWGGAYEGAAGLLGGSTGGWMANALIPSLAAGAMTMFVPGLGLPAGALTAGASLAGLTGQYAAGQTALPEQLQSMLERGGREPDVFAQIGRRFTVPTEGDVETFRRRFDIQAEMGELPPLPQEPQLLVPGGPFMDLLRLMDYNTEANELTQPILNEGFDNVTRAIGAGVKGLEDLPVGVAQSAMEIIQTGIREEALVSPEVAAQTAAEMSQLLGRVPGGAIAAEGEEPTRFLPSGLVTRWAQAQGMGEDPMAVLRAQRMAGGRPLYAPIEPSLRRVRGEAPGIMEEYYPEIEEALGVRGFEREELLAFAQVTQGVRRAMLSAGETTGAMEEFTNQLADLFEGGTEEGLAMTETLAEWAEQVAGMRALGYDIEMPDPTQYGTQAEVSQARIQQRFREQQITGLGGILGGLGADPTRAAAAANVFAGQPGEARGFGRFAQGDPWAVTRFAQGNMNVFDPNAPAAGRTRAAMTEMFGGEIPPELLEVMNKLRPIIDTRTGLQVGVTSFPGFGEQLAEGIESGMINLPGELGGEIVTLIEEEGTRGLQVRQTQVQRGYQEWQWGQRERSLDWQRTSQFGGDFEGFSTRGTFAIQRELRDLGRIWEDFTNDYQQQQRQLQYGQFMENWQVRAGRAPIQFQEQREDLAFRGAQQTMQYGWGMEDIEEALRYATGRERRKLLRQQERATISYGMGMGQLGVQGERIDLREQWSQEDLERERRHFLERFALQDQYQSKYRWYTEERRALENELQAIHEHGALFNLEQAELALAKQMEIQAQLNAINDGFLAINQVQQNNVALAQLVANLTAEALANQHAAAQVQLRMARETINVYSSVIQYRQEEF